MIEGIEREVEGMEVVVSKEKIVETVDRLAEEIASDYQGKVLLLVGVLNGCVPFIGDLAVALGKRGIETRQDYVKVSSYGDGTESSRTPRLDSDVGTDIQGRDVVIVEDIIDTGYSLEMLREMLEAKEPASLAIVALLSKPSRREVDVPVEYIGLEIPNKFVVGYGLDAGGRFRWLEDIRAVGA